MIRVRLILEALIVCFLREKKKQMATSGARSFFLGGHTPGTVQVLPVVLVADLEVTPGISTGRRKR